MEDIMEGSMRVENNEENMESFSTQNEIKKRIEPTECNATAKLGAEDTDVFERTGTDSLCPGPDRQQSAIANPGSETATVLGLQQQPSSSANIRSQDEETNSSSDSDDVGDDIDIESDEDLENNVVIQNILEKEETLTDDEIGLLLDALGFLEGDAAEAEEALEEETLETVRKEVTEELSASVSKRALDVKVEMEMETLVENWRRRHDFLQRKICSLLEKLDSEGIDLAQVYKTMESQIAATCQTETWKTRAHWAGCPTGTADWKLEAELEMTHCRPTRIASDRKLDENAADSDSESDDDSDLSETDQPHTGKKRKKCLEIDELEDLDTALCPKNIQPWQYKRAVKKERELEKKRKRRSNVQKVGENQDRAMEEKKVRRQQKRKRMNCEPASQALGSMEGTQVRPSSRKKVLTTFVTKAQGLEQNPDLHGRVLTPSFDVQQEVEHHDALVDGALRQGLDDHYPENTSQRGLGHHVVPNAVEANANAPLSAEAEMAIHGSTIELSGNVENERLQNGREIRVEEPLHTDEEKQVGGKLREVPFHKEEKEQEWLSENAEERQREERLQELEEKQGGPCGTFVADLIIIDSDIEDNLPLNVRRSAIPPAAPLDMSACPAEFSKVFSNSSAGKENYDCFKEAVQMPATERDSCKPSVPGQCANMEGEAGDVKGFKNHDDIGQSGDTSSNSSQISSSHEMIKSKASGKTPATEISPSIQEPSSHQCSMIGPTVNEGGKDETLTMEAEELSEQITIDKAKNSKAHSEENLEKQSIRTGEEELRPMLSVLEQEVPAMKLPEDIHSVLMKSSVPMLRSSILKMGGNLKGCIEKPDLVDEFLRAHAKKSEPRDKAIHKTIALASAAQETFVTLHSEDISEGVLRTEMIEVAEESAKVVGQTLTMKVDSLELPMQLGDLEDRGQKKDAEEVKNLADICRSDNPCSNIQDVMRKEDQNFEEVKLTNSNRKDENVNRQDMPEPEIKREENEETLERGNIGILEKEEGQIDVLLQERVNKEVMIDGENLRPTPSSPQSTGQSMDIPDDFFSVLMNTPVSLLRVSIEKMGGNCRGCIEKEELANEYLRAAKYQESKKNSEECTPENPSGRELAIFSDDSQQSLRRSRRIIQRDQTPKFAANAAAQKVVELNSDGEKEVDMDPTTEILFRSIASPDHDVSKQTCSSSQDCTHDAGPGRPQEGLEAPKAEDFMCTACGKFLSALHIHKHPLLEVLVCRSCVNRYNKDQFKKDEFGVEDDCRWCALGGSVIICDTFEKTCSKVFCEECVIRNFGKEALKDIFEDHWQCFVCNPAAISSLRSRYKEAEEVQKKLVEWNGESRKLTGPQRRRARKSLSDKTPSEKLHPKRALEEEKFLCTACGESQKLADIRKHPLLGVSICPMCLARYAANEFTKDVAGVEEECRWCAQSKTLVLCDNSEKPCNFVFCVQCMKRNFGLKELAIAEKPLWKCYLCSTDTLSTLQMSYRMAEERKTLLEQDENEENVSHKSNKKKLRKIMDQSQEVQLKQSLEEERQERIALRTAKAAERAIRARKRKWNPSVQGDGSVEGYDEEEDDPQKGISINKARDDNEDRIRIDPQLSKQLKRHQVEGIRFMWNNCIESVQKVKDGDEGVGCILAHCMGLGKTLQVVAFLHTVLNHAVLELKTVLIVVPANVLFNWKNEFQKWQSGLKKAIHVYMLEDIKRCEEDLAAHAEKWHNDGGVFLMGYTTFLNLSTGKILKERKARDSFWKTLVDPGPSLLICDEAHLIKNPQAQITKALGDVSTKRKIALTGSPLQNNLTEYFCMVDFVRRGHLGSLKEFRNRYENPIKRGQQRDADRKDAQRMKRRIYALSQQLRGFVQRRGSNFLEKFLPAKHVYVVAVRLSPLQRVLYNQFWKKVRQSTTRSGAGVDVMTVYSEAIKICNHPDLLRRSQKQEPVEDGGNEADQKSSSENDGDKPENDMDEVLQGQAGLNPVDVTPQFIKKSSEITQNWWEKILAAQPGCHLRHSGKMVVLMDILEQTTKAAEKVLIFSHSLHTLNMIEDFLSTFTNEGKQGWRKNHEYYRIDGTVPSRKRQKLVDRFNDPRNATVTCMLISTRAGGVGINLTAANRVVLMDGGWNPTHDLQAVYRVWRFGQTKEVVAYRLVSYGTIEEKVYHRQVSKEGLAARVVDSHHVARHFTNADLEVLFHLDEDGDDFQFDELDWENLSPFRETDAPPQRSCPSAGEAVGESSGDLQHVSETHSNKGGSLTEIVPESVLKKFTTPLCHSGDPDEGIKRTGETGDTGNGPPSVTVGGQAEDEGKDTPNVWERNSSWGARGFIIPDGKPPKDVVLKRLLLKHRPKWIVRHHEHGHLLQELDEEKLSEEEKKAAWNEVLEEMENEKAAEQAAQAFHAGQAQGPMHLPNFMVPPQAGPAPPPAPGLDQDRGLGQFRSSASTSVHNVCESSAQPLGGQGKIDFEAHFVRRGEGPSEMRSGDV